MASTAQRRPLPAVLSLLALLLLTGLVWWRVINRSSGHTSDSASKPACPSASSSTQTLPAPATITVQVLNATTKKGVAGKARAAFIADGFKSPSAAGNDVTKKINKIKSPGEIRYGPTGKAGASLVRYYLPGAALVATKSKNATVVVALGTAYRGVASQAAVTAALKKAGLAAGTPSPSAGC